MEIKVLVLKIQTAHNYGTRNRLITLNKKLNVLTDEVVPRNGRLVDAYLKLSHRYWSMLSALEARNSRVELLERELKNYVPDHWIFEDEYSDDEEDNVSDEPDDDQLEFDFETDHLKPN